MSLELDAAGHPGPGGCFPNSVGDSPGRQPLVHWCHGAPGAVFLFCKAYEVLGHVEFREVAERAGAVVWRDGLLRKGPGLCHGVAGNGYALLALSRATGNKQYWYQAQQVKCASMPLTVQCMLLFVAGKVFCVCAYTRPLYVPMHD